MKRLNSYILEKFKITKKNLVKEYLDKNKYYVAISIRGYGAKNALKIYYPFYILECDKNHVKYITNKLDDTKTKDQKTVNLESNVVFSGLNKNGYYQVAFSNNTSCIFLDFDNFFNFVRDIYPNFNSNKKYTDQEELIQDLSKVNKGNLTDYFEINIDDDLEYENSCQEMLDIYKCVKKNYEKS